MINSQDISRFVYQSKPRDVPKNILLAAGAPSYLIATIIEFGSILGTLLICSLLSLGSPQLGGFTRDIMLNIGKNTTQGNIIDWERRQERRTGRGSSLLPQVYYRIGISFSTISGEITADCYVTVRESIPGWGLIPESRNIQASDAGVRLREPFPITIEYASWAPSIARAVGTQASLGSILFYLIFFPLLGTMPLAYAVFWYIRRNLKRRLAESLFATGFVKEYSIQKDNCRISVSFSGQDGSERTGYRILPKRAEAVYRQWAAERRKIGGLYLLDKEDVIITDLWLKV